MPSPVTIHFIPHTHWDREWYLTQKQFQYRLTTTVAEILEAMTAPRGRRLEKFTLDGQTVILRDLLEWHPKWAKPIATLVREGRLDLGSWFTMPDLWLPTPEALARNLDRGMADRRVWGAPRQDFIYVPDSFGMPAGLPALLRAKGFSTLLIGRGQPVRFGPDPVDFRWTTPDGRAGVNVLVLPNSYTSAAFLPPAGDTARLRSWMGNLIQSYARKAVPDVLGAFSGADHIASQRDLPEIIAMLRRLFPQYRFVQSTLTEYVAAVAARMPHRLPVHRGSIRGRLCVSELHGTWSSRQEIKRDDHLCSYLLVRAEALAREAAAAGAAPLHVPLNRAWEWLMLNHAHDSICGCSPDDTVADQASRYRWIKQVATDSIEESLRFLALRRFPRARAAILRPPSGGSLLGLAELELDGPAGVRTSFLAGSAALQAQELASDVVQRFDYAFAHEPGRHAKAIHAALDRTRYLVRLPHPSRTTVVRLASTNRAARAPAGKPGAPRLSLGAVTRLLESLEIVRDVGGLYAHMPVGRPVLWRPRAHSRLDLESGPLRWAYRISLDYAPLRLARHTWAPEPAVLRRDLTIRLFPHLPVAVVDETWTGRIDYARLRLPLPAANAATRVAWNEFDITRTKTIAALARVPADLPADRSFFFRSWLQIARPGATPLVLFGNGLHDFGLAGRGSVSLAVTLLRPQGHIGFCSPWTAPGAQFHTPYTFRYALWFGTLSARDKVRFADELAVPVLAEPNHEYVPPEGAGLGIATVETCVGGRPVTSIPLNWRPVLNHRSGWRRPDYIAE